MKTEPKYVKAGNVTFGNDLPLVLIAGPCQMETRDHAIMMVEKLLKVTGKYKVPFVYKTSFDKANRTSLKGQRGIGLAKAMPVFREISEKYKIPTLTDVHSEEQIKEVAEFVDILQIPAFLCRQTDLLLAAGNSGKIVNVKKGQFLAPWDMKNVAEKVASTGNKKILLTERGASFGYNTLVTDMRALPIMAETGYPVVFDSTHSVQQPGGQGGASGGQREFVEVLAKAAVAVGVAGIFAETHQDPENAPSDGPCMLNLNSIDRFLSILTQLDKISKS